MIELIFILISFVMFGMILSPITAYCIHKIISKYINDNISIL